MQRALSGFKNQIMAILLRRAAENDFGMRLAFWFQNERERERERERTWVEERVDR
jgi:hypothetical protein